jgi:hypothetical protein
MRLCTGEYRAGRPAASCDADRGSYWRSRFSAEIHGLLLGQPADQMDVSSFPRYRISAIDLVTRHIVCKIHIKCTTGICIPIAPGAAAVIAARCFR